MDWLFVKLVALMVVLGFVGLGTLDIPVAILLFVMYGEKIADALDAALKAVAAVCRHLLDRRLGEWFVRAHSRAYDEAQLINERQELSEGATMITIPVAQLCKGDKIAGHGYEVEDVARLPHAGSHRVIARMASSRYATITRTWDSEDIHIKVLRKE